MGTQRSQRGGRVIEGRSSGGSSSFDRSAPDPESLTSRLLGQISVALCVLSAVALSGHAVGQECHDWDGDAATGGFECVSASDCEDNAWRRRPGAVEVCDGLDTDCDGDLDQGCDRFCDQPFLFRNQVDLDHPEFGSYRGCSAYFDDGALVITESIIDGSIPSQDQLLYARAYGRVGVPLGPPVAIGDPGCRTLRPGAGPSERPPSSRRLPARRLRGAGAGRSRLERRRPRPSRSRQRRILAIHRLHTTRGVR